MNKTQYFENILPVIDPILSKQGYTFKKSKDSFIKKIKDGYIKVQFDFYEFGLTYNINVGFFVRINSVQELFVHYVRGNPNLYKDSYTLLLTLPELLNHSEKIFRFQYPSELNPILQGEILPFLENWLPRLADKYSSLENIFKFYYNFDEENHQYVKPTYDSFIIPIIIAKLLNRGDVQEIIEWADMNLKELKENNSGSMDAVLYDQYFDKIIQDLGN